MDLGKYPINRVVSLTTKSQKGKFQCIQNTLLLSLHINIIYPYNCSDFKAVLAAQQNIPHHSKGDLLSLLLQQTSKMTQLTMWSTTQEPNPTSACFCIALN